MVVQNYIRIQSEWDEIKLPGNLLKDGQAINVGNNWLNPGIFHTIF